MTPPGRGPRKTKGLAAAARQRARSEGRVRCLMAGGASNPGRPLEEGRKASEPLSGPTENMLLGNPVKRGSRVARSGPFEEAGGAWT
jgi:hypothetical protein